MEKALPQEIDVWYVLPALRRELAKIFIKDYEKSQKEVAQILGITEAAISQYINDKRANELVFTEEEVAKIKDTAKQLVNDKENVMGYMTKLLHRFRGTESVCKLHRKLDRCVPTNCDICMDH
jgi:hypothetical protein